MLNWTTLTDNPVDVSTRKVILEELKKKRSVKCQTYREYLHSQIKGKRILDIGVAEHDISHINQDGWQHKFIVEHSSYCVGVDIIEDLVTLLNTKGYNIKCVDATSDIDLGERFDVVLIGDVIEHVNNPVDLLKFAMRHCTENAIVIVATPNPFFYKNFIDTIRNSTFVANFEHISWITPSMAMEIARRAGAELKEYLFFSKCHRHFQSFWHHKFPEIFRDRFCYIFKNE